LNRLDQMVGQTQAVERLLLLLESGRLPHALLLEGPAGAGKATLAQLLAKVCLCQGSDVPGVACGNCGACAKIEAGSHADLLRLEGQSGRIKVDAVRREERSLRFRSVEGKGQWLLIEDADQLTKEAQNALLKTLEEPPAEVHIVLTSSRPETLLPTVLSRCQRITLRPVPESAIAALVMERLGVDEGAARVIAALAHGSLGAALASDPEERLTARSWVEAFDQNLDTGSADPVRRSLEQAEELAADRPQMQARLDLLEAWLRDQVVLCAGAPSVELVNEDRRSTLEALAARRGLHAVLLRVQSTQAARGELERSNNLNALMVATSLCLELSGLKPPGTEAGIHRLGASNRG
jgi:DNA polymerase III subunit delta'